MILFELMWRFSLPFWKKGNLKFGSAKEAMIKR
jgi:hypothetical protein